MSASRLRLLQLVSPALPVGAFSYSEGLEALVQEGRLVDAQAVQRWLEAELRRGTLAVEAAALAPLSIRLRAWRDVAAGPAPLATAEAAGAVADLDGWLLAHREAPELRAQQRQMGQSLLQLLAQLGWPLPAPGPAGPPRLAWTSAWAWATAVRTCSSRMSLRAFSASKEARASATVARMSPPAKMGTPRVKPPPQSKVWRSSWAP
jgi:urease accessory protein